MFTITKKIEFCYGHRLMKYEGKCRHLHGHNGVIEVDISTAGLDGRGMVLDFSDIKRTLKTWVDETLDHKMILCKHDPVIPLLKQNNEVFYLMEENPTAENMAKLIFDFARKQGLPVVEVRLWETSTSCASYRG
jgi:6-pyruvoyltetrahydropterin/6-carboxytetrahydropterin synthase